VKAALAQAKAAKSSRDAARAPKQAMSVAGVVHGTPYRAALYALLLTNAFCYAWAGTRSEALDAAAWLVLLALFDIETRWPEWLHSGSRRALLRLVRLAAAAGVVAAMAGYAVEEDVLDAVNSVLWIAVVILLEAEVRFPELVAKARRAFTATAVLLYGGLAVLVVLWAAQRLWFDAYDALLWLVAFATLELNVLRKTGKTASV
jgi:hypothetical protein